jgi:hypothetical protein
MPWTQTTLAPKLRVLELFSGGGTISKAFKSVGHFAFQVDIRRRRGVCWPDLRADVADLRPDTLPGPFDVVWASPPCDVWSYAAGNLHFDRGSWTPKTEKAQKHVLLLLKTIELIEAIRPAQFFIENPRGRLRHFPPFKSWLEKMGGHTCILTLGSYGFPHPKPTNLFTNTAFIARPLAQFGRGAKVPGTLSDLTKCQRQATPPALAYDLVAFCEKAGLHERPDTFQPPSPGAAPIKTECSK